jgi:hypothetical protein
MPHIPPQAITKVAAERLLKKDATRNAERAAARKAKREAAKAEADAAKQALADEAERVAKAHAVDERPAALRAQWVDFCALNDIDPDGGDPVRSVYGEAFAEYLTEQGIGPDGAPLVDPDAAEEKVGYTGPMVALKAARMQYVPAANGALCNGDALALICGKHERAVTVAALIRALKLPGNPYAAMNPGQQSMNLRNRARHALKNGLLTMAEIEAAYAAA